MFCVMYDLFTKRYLVFRSVCVQSLALSVLSSYRLSSSLFLVRPFFFFFGNSEDSAIGDTGTSPNIPFYRGSDRTVYGLQKQVPYLEQRNVRWGKLLQLVSSDLRCPFLLLGTNLLEGRTR